MYHDLPDSASFWSFLLAVDEDLAEQTRKNGCPCGGRLHAANYLRKPRGTPDQLPEPQRLRHSFCCERDGCRKRATPPSVRFLGRKASLGAIVILISALRQGPTPRRVRELSQRCGADQSTIARWQVFGRDHFPQTPFWKAARAGLLTLGQYPQSDGRPMGAVSILRGRLALELSPWARTAENGDPLPRR